MTRTIIAAAVFGLALIVSGCGGGGKHVAVVGDQPSCLAPGGDTIGAFGEVIQGTEKQHRVVCVRRSVDTAGVADLGGESLVVTETLQRLLDVGGHRVDEMHLMAVGEQPFGVDAGAAADVENAQRRVREVPSDDLLRAQQLELTHPLSESDVLIDSLLVVL